MILHRVSRVRFFVRSLSLSLSRRRMMCITVSLLSSLLVFLSIVLLALTGLCIKNVFISRANSVFPYRYHQDGTFIAFLMPLWLKTVRGKCSLNDVCRKNYNSISPRKSIRKPSLPITTHLYHRRTYKSQLLFSSNSTHPETTHA